MSNEKLNKMYEIIMEIARDNKDNNFNGGNRVLSQKFLNEIENLDLGEEDENK